MKLRLTDGSAVVLNDFPVQSDGFARGGSRTVTQRKITSRSSAGWQKGNFGGTLRFQAHSWAEFEATALSTEVFS